VISATASVSIYNVGGGASDSRAFDWTENLMRSQSKVMSSLVHMARVRECTFFNDLPNVHFVIVLKHTSLQITIKLTYSY